MTNSLALAELRGGWGLKSPLRHFSYFLGTIIFISSRYVFEYMSLEEEIVALCDVVKRASERIKKDMVPMHKGAMEEKIKITDHLKTINDQVTIVVKNKENYAQVHEACRQILLATGLITFIIKQVTDPENKYRRNIFLALRNIQKATKKIMKDEELEHVEEAAA